MPLITCEMRWFFDGRIPSEVEHWFQHDHPPAEVAWREDRYLVLPGVADMGIKEREGRLEIKGRTAVLGTHTIAPGIMGSAESWSKWAYGAGVAERFRSCSQGREAIVGKGRAQRHFLLEPGGRAQETAQRDLTRPGLSLELTRINLPASGDHWSLGVEAAPDGASLIEDLLRALSDILQGFPMPLPRARSMSYPAWLAQHAPDAG